MKKIISILLLSVPLMSITACSGDSLESDVRKMANYQCRMQQLATTGELTEANKAEMAKIEVDMKAFGEKMEAKYKDKRDDPAMKARAEKVMADVMANCK